MDRHPASIREHELPWPADVDPARWLLGATSSGEPHRRAVVATWQEIERLRRIEAAAKDWAEKRVQDGAITGKSVIPSAQALLDALAA